MPEPRSDDRPGGDGAGPDFERSEQWWDDYTRPWTPPAPPDAAPAPGPPPAAGRPAAPDAPDAARAAGPPPGGPGAAARSAAPAALPPARREDTYPRGYRNGDGYGYGGTYEGARDPYRTGRDPHPAPYPPAGPPADPPAGPAAYPPPAGPAADRAAYPPPAAPTGAPPAAPPGDAGDGAGSGAGDGGNAADGPADASAPDRSGPPPGWQPITVGKPGYGFEPKPPPGKPYRPDTVQDGWSTDAVTVRLASVRGEAHRYAGTPRQDDVAVAVHEATQTVVFAVADGVSAAEQSAIGSTLACRGAVDDLLHQLDAHVPSLDWSHAVRTAAWQLVARAAAGREPEGAYSQEAERLYATTLVAGTVRVRAHGVLEVSLVQVGDSGAWVLDGATGRYLRLLTTKDSRGDAVVSSAVTPLPRVPSPLPVQTAELGPASVLLVGTDGFGDALGDGSGQIGRLFHRHLRTPPPARGLAHLLDFSRDTFDDDRTLFAVWPRHLLPGAGG